MALIGYAPGSTEDQFTVRQLDELRAAGCTEILEEHASGGDRSRPILAQTLARLRPATRRSWSRSTWVSIFPKTLTSDSAGPASSSAGAPATLPVGARLRR